MQSDESQALHYDRRPNANADLAKSIDALIKTRPGAEIIQASGFDKAVALNDFLYMSQGSSNAYMVATDEGRVIINTGMGFESRNHKALFDAECSAPTQYIITTQGHVDHVGGVSRFREKGTRFVAQANNQICQLDDARIAKRRAAMSQVWFSHIIKDAMKLAKDFPDAFVQDTPVPDITFRCDYSFSLGGIDFELIATPGGETIDSMVVWLPQHKILFSGNQFGPLFPHYPNFNTIRGDRYRFTESYLESLRTIKALGAETLITGHGNPIYGAELIEGCLARLEAAVEHVHFHTLAGIRDGKMIWELMDTIKLPPEINVGEGYGLVRWGVRTIWEGYLGWFHQESTTELYAQRHDCIYSDLIELAGVDAVAHKARAHLDSGEPVKAIYLAEALLQNNDECQFARTLMVDAHNTLLETDDAKNFWAKGWLQYQVDKYNN